MITVTRSSVSNFRFVDKQGKPSPVPLCIIQFTRPHQKHHMDFSCLPHSYQTCGLTSTSTQRLYYTLNPLAFHRCLFSFLNQPLQLTINQPLFDCSITLIQNENQRRLTRQWPKANLSSTATVASPSETCSYQTSKSTLALDA